MLSTKWCKARATDHTASGHARGALAEAGGLAFRWISRLVLIDCRLDVAEGGRRAALLQHSDGIAELVCELRAVTRPLVYLSTAAISIPFRPPAPAARTGAVPAASSGDAPKAASAASPTPGSSPLQKEKIRRDRRGKQHHLTEFTASCSCVSLSAMPLLSFPTRIPGQVGPGPPPAGREEPRPRVTRDLVKKLSHDTEYQSRATKLLAQCKRKATARF